MDGEIDADKIWKEIEDVIGAPLQERQPGDIDLRQLAEHHNCTERYAYDLMVELEATGKWEILTVKGTKSGSKSLSRVRVLRKILT